MSNKCYILYLNWLYSASIMGRGDKSSLLFTCFSKLIILTICNLVFSVLTSDSQHNKILTDNSNKISLEKLSTNATDNLNETDDIIRKHDIIVKKCGRMDRCVRNPDNPWDRFAKIQMEPYQCRCDEESICLEYGDCCPTNVTKTVTKNPWKCSLVQSKTWALMISSCYSYNSDKKLKKLCTLESLLSDEYAYQLDLPVYSKTGKFYRNINCALCSGASFDDINSLKVRILCNKNVSKTQTEEFLKESLYKPGERYWEYGDTFCGLYIPELDAQQINKTNIQTRLCGPKVIDSCPSDWVENRTSKLCYSYMQTVNSRSHYIFKNPYCAMCNNISIDNSSNIACYRNISPKRIESDLIMGPRGYQLIYDHTCEMRSLLQENDTTNSKFVIADCLIGVSPATVQMPVYPVCLLFYISIVNYCLR